jgi:hypothetical protein
VFAQISESHQRRQQDSQGQAQGYQVKGGIEKHFGKHLYINAFPHHVVHIFPKKLHQQDKKANAECYQNQWQKSVEKKRIKPFYTEHKFSQLKCKGSEKELRTKN